MEIVRVPLPYYGMMSSARRFSQYLRHNCVTNATEQLIRAVIDKGTLKEEGVLRAWIVK